MGAVDIGPPACGISKVMGYICGSDVNSGQLESYSGPVSNNGPGRVAQQYIILHVGASCCSFQVVTYCDEPDLNLLPAEALKEIQFL